MGLMFLHGIRANWLIFRSFIKKSSENISLVKTGIHVSEGVKVKNLKWFIHVQCFCTTWLVNQRRRNPKLIINQSPTYTKNQFISLSIYIYTKSDLSTTYTDHQSITNICKHARGEWEATNYLWNQIGEIKGRKE